MLDSFVTKGFGVSKEVHKKNKNRIRGINQNVKKKKLIIFKFQG